MYPTLALLPSLAIRPLGPLEDPFGALYSVVNTHAVSRADCLTKLAAHACWATKEPDGGFRRERVGVCTLRGGEAGGLAPAPGAGLVRRALRAGSERLVEKQVAQLASACINVAVAWGDIDESALTRADQHSIMVIRARSRRDMVYLSEPGKCRRVYQQELGEGLAVVFEWECPGTPAVTLVLRGATAQGLQGAEQAAYRGMDAYFQLCQDPRLLPGAGATETALAKMLSEKGSQLDGPNGPAFLAFAQAVRSLPETLAENAGLAVSQVMAEMNRAHQAGNFLVGVGVEGIINVAQEEVWDTLTAKARGLRAIADVTLQLVSVDEIVVAKQSATYQRDSNPVPKKAKRCLFPVKDQPLGTTE
ncbi:t-complex protein 1 [Lynx pardinus]|uniref:T-complex protein 1 n=1 Tax=Lynx pardinus TaxID=191816 RepID=A0A485PP93_LYNPA|nr:t-complex protein 1 [Lynx pardinus]